MPDSVGIDRETGRLLVDFDHVRQSLNVIFTTRITTRVLRRNFGSAVPGLLGQPLTQADILRWYLAIVIAVELWEPRFRVISISFPTSENSPSRLQQGQFGATILGAYRPRALQGDFTVEGTASVIL